MTSLGVEDPNLCLLPFDGTSASAQEVAGVAGLLLSYMPSLYNDDIEYLLKATATDIQYDLASPGYDEYTGWGRINADSGNPLSSGVYVYRLAAGDDASAKKMVMVK